MSELHYLFTNPANPETFGQIVTTNGLTEDQKQSNPVRIVCDDFEIEPINSIAVNGYCLGLFDTGRRADGKSCLAYRFYQIEPQKFIFAGSDFWPSPVYAIDSEETALALLAFLLLREGDTDGEYFDAYTPEQIEFRDSSARDDLFYWLYIEKGFGG